MPSSPVLETRNCLVCNTPLSLKIKRDIARKFYCSRSCSNSHSALKRIEALPVKRCINCNSEYKPKSTNQKICFSEKCKIDAQIERSYKWMHNNPEAYIGHLLKKENRKHLLVDQILQLYNKQAGKCALSGIPLTFIKIPNTSKVHTNLSLDRIDSNKGYDLQNIQLVCAIVNTMKLNLTQTEFNWWIRQLYQTQGED